MLQLKNLILTATPTKPKLYELKHIEIDCHFIREKLEQKIITTSYVKSEDQLADLLNKALPGPRVRFMCNKLGAYDVYAPA